MNHSLYVRSIRENGPYRPLVVLAPGDSCHAPLLKFRAICALETPFM
jgi:hypothetical protein